MQSVQPGVFPMNHAPEVIAAAVARGLDAARDRAQPDDADKQPENYTRLGEAFRRSAWQHLVEDNDDGLPQASNKAWELVAETVEAIGAQHGGAIHAHRSILMVLVELTRLLRESDDTDTAAWINNAFNTARILHTNFYENEMPVDQVEDGLRLSEQLSERLYELFWPERPTN